MTRIKAVIFDLDGVLVEAKDWHYFALNKALKIFGLEISYDDHIKTFDGLPTRKKLEYLNRNLGLPKDLNGVISELKQVYTHEHFLTQCLPSFTLEHLFERLNKRGIKTAVASNSIRSTVTLALKNLSLMDSVEFFLSNEDVVAPKPAPEIYVKAIDMLGLDPHECLIIEDNFNGIAAARASGAHVLEVAEVDDVNYLNVFREIERLDARR